MKRVQILLMCLVFLIAMTANGSAADLIIDGTTVTLYGEVEYDSVQIINGGVLYVTPYDGTDGTGTLTINANSIIVDATSSINAAGAGYRGVENGNGEGPGGGEGGPTVMDGGGGGSYGGKGGYGWRDYWIGGTDGAGGSSYGSATSMSILMGSAGGAAGTGDFGDYGGFGGSGGGAISLLANIIDIAGTITANGDDGHIVAYNKITADVSPDCAFYTTSGICLYSDARPGALGGPVQNNKVVHNTSVVTGWWGDEPAGDGFEITDWPLANGKDATVTGNNIGFNDFRGSTIEMYFYPEEAEDNNTISRNLGENRGHGLTPANVFRPIE